MLHFQSEEHRLYMEEVKALATKIGRGEQLQEQLDYLDTYRDKEHTRCTLYPDRAWGQGVSTDFGFVMYMRKEGTEEWVRWFSGGLLYHGPHDGFGSGAGPTFAVTLTPTAGWSVHT